MCQLTCSHFTKCSGIWNSSLSRKCNCLTLWFTCQAGCLVDTPLILLHQASFTCHQQTSFPSEEKPNVCCFFLHQRWIRDYRQMWEVTKYKFFVCALSSTVRLLSCFCFVFVLFILLLTFVNKYLNFILLKKSCKHFHVQKIHILFKRISYNLIFLLLLEVELF